jgi:hypothetical protein
MSSQLFNDKEQIFRDVIRLAEAWNSAYDTSGFDGGSIKEIRDFETTPTGQRIQAAEDALNNYMSNLNFDDVKMLQTVMYLGRDRDYDKSLSSLGIYNDYLKYIGRNGWNSKEIEINQMTEKMPLADYLKCGLEVLSVAI